MNEVTLFRLYLLRALYLLIVVGLGLEIWPGLILREKPWETMESVVACMLAAFSLLSILGLRYPLQMLPLLLWELVWKTLWLIIIAAPLWSAGTMDEPTRAVAFAVSMVIIIPFIIPWPYIIAHYLKKPGERWRKTEV